MHIIYDNGVHNLTSDYVSGVTSLFVSGSLGGGTARLGYVDSTGTFIPFTDGSVLVGEQYEVRHGKGNPLMLELLGSTGAALECRTGETV